MVATTDTGIRLCVRSAYNMVVNVNRGYRRYYYRTYIIHKLTTTTVVHPAVAGSATASAAVELSLYNMIWVHNVMGPDLVSRPFSLLLFVIKYILVVIIPVCLCVCTLCRWDGGGLTVVSMIIFAHHAWLPITLFRRPFYLKYVSHSAGGYSIILCELADQSERREHAILSV